MQRGHQVSTCSSILRRFTGINAARADVLTDRYGVSVLIKRIAIHHMVGLEMTCYTLSDVFVDVVLSFDIAM